MQAKADLYVETHQPFQRQPTGRTVGMYLYEWFDGKKSAWAPRTVELYRHQLEKHILPRIGEVLLEDLTPLDVQRLVNQIVTSGHIPTANKCRRLLFTAMKQAVRWELVPKNPVDAVDPVREPPVEKVVWEPTEAEAFLGAVKGHRLYPAFYLLYASGMRRGELLGLRWSDVKEAGVRVEQALVMVGNSPTISSPKSRRSKRFIPLAPDALEQLELHREAQRREREACGERWCDYGLVFCTSIGTPLDPKNFLRTLRQYSKKAGVGEGTVHAIRHLHASLLIASEVDAKTISERLGHSSAAFTLDRYGHIFRQHQGRSALSVDQLLRGSGSVD
ncbi:MAG: site-specific integrase [Trueperaceae bacterium]